jgi:hypothetical protein
LAELTSGGNAPKSNTAVIWHSFQIVDISAYETNCGAAKADTWSAAAGTTAVVGPTAAAFCAVNSEPIPANWPAADVSMLGCVVTKVIGFSFAGKLKPHLYHGMKIRRRHEKSSTRG